MFVSTTLTETMESCGKERGEEERERENFRVVYVSLCSFILEVIYLPQLLFPSSLLPLTAHHSMHPPTVSTSCARDVTNMFSTTHCADPAHPATSKINLPTLSLSSFALLVAFSLTRSFTNFTHRFSFGLFYRFPLSLPPTATQLPSSSCSLSHSFFLSLSDQLLYLIPRAGSSRESRLALRARSSTLLPPPSSTAGPYVFSKTDGDFVIRIRGRHVGSFEIRQQKHRLSRVPVLNKCSRI